MKTLNTPFLIQKTFFLVLCSALSTTLFAQDPGNIPPPSGTEPERVRIPIAVAQKKIAEGDTGDATENEVVAFAIAANAKGWIPKDSSGRLLNGMQIRVTVMVQGVMEHSTEPQRINHSGAIGLPLLQNVDVGGKDMGDVEKLLTEKYAEFYVQPLVNIEVVGNTNDPSQCPWGFITIMGNVGSPGPLAMPPTQLLTISGAVKTAGGLASSANKDAIRIFRPHPEEDTVEVIRVDLEILAKKGKQAEDVSLRAGDVVYIPERIF